MPVKFRCPQGHTLTCTEDRVGKPGKCPKCGVRFVVPEAGEQASKLLGDPSGSDAAAEEGALQQADSSGNGGASSDSGSTASAVDPATGVKPEGREGDDVIVFLCPNGHKLNGPSRLQGQPGQCPHCGAKFRIPIYDEQEEEPDEFPAEDIAVGSVDDEIDIIDHEEVEEFPDDDDIEMVSDVEELPNVERPPALQGAAHPLAHVFATLWESRGDDAVVELDLGDDSPPLVPEDFSAALSQDKYGVFSVKAEDSTYTITVVPWDSVRRAVLKRVDQLPGRLFSE